MRTPSHLLRSSPGSGARHEKKRAREDSGRTRGEHCASQQDGCTQQERLRHREHSLAASREVDHGLRLALVHLRLRVVRVVAAIATSKRTFQYRRLRQRSADPMILVYFCFAD